jgi:UDP-N-acetyl-D-galactosamine dehydrogenase
LEYRSGDFSQNISQDYFQIPADIKICVIGLGYVGLPLALALGREFYVVGYDHDMERVRKILKEKKCFSASGHYDTPNHGIGDFKKNIKDENSKGLILLDNENSTDNKPSLCNVYIIAVPTPVYKNNTPDRTCLSQAVMKVAGWLGRGDTVIFESTVYPGCTEEFCVPLLERLSGLRYNRDFFCGYSPERISPGDACHILENTVKLTSGSSPRTAEFVDSIYRKIIPAGTFMTRNIRTAEASKIMENAQRDVNIAFMNEMAVFFNSMDINMNDVLTAAGTKWNFLSFTPGLVGGHCIGVDSYWLAWKASDLGVPVDILLSSRKKNESMAPYIVQRIAREMTRRKINPVGADVLILGFSFKENCGDCRNTKVHAIVKGLELRGCRTVVCDPHADKDFIKKEYGLEILSVVPPEAEDWKFDAVVGSVAHDEFKYIDPMRYLRRGGFVFDVKNMFSSVSSQARKCL